MLRGYYWVNADVRMDWGKIEREFDLSLASIWVQIYQIYIYYPSFVV